MVFIFLKILIIPMSQRASRNSGGAGISRSAHGSASICIFPWAETEKLWHGAGWNFILWGLYYFVLLVLEKFVLRPVLERLPSVIQHLYTLFFVVVGWVIFACDDLGLLGSYLKAMFGIGVPAGNALALYEWDVQALFLVILLIAATTIPVRIAKQLTREEQRSPLLMVYTGVLLALSLAFLVSGSYNPFLYFRF